MCLNIGTSNNHHFPFGINRKVVVLGIPILKHFRVLENLKIDNYPEHYHMQQGQADQEDDDNII